MASSAIFDEVEKAGGVAGVVAGELVSAQGKRCRLKAVAGAVLAGQGGGQVTLGHAHGGVGAAVPAAEPTRNMPLTFLGDASYSRRNILYTASIR